MSSPNRTSKPANSSGAVIVCVLLTNEFMFCQDALCARYEFGKLDYEKIVQYIFWRIESEYIFEHQCLDNVHKGPERLTRTCCVASRIDRAMYIYTILLVAPLNLYERGGILSFYSTLLYQPLPANFSPGAMLPQLMPTIASPRPALHSAMILASL